MILLLRFSGTSPFTIRCAMPSAMAVLPTPGSPTRMGLFLVRRESIWSVLLISSSLPITGSSLPWRASSFRFLAYLFRALNSWDCVCEVTVSPFRSSRMAVISPFSVSPASLSSFPTASLPCTRASRICSGVTNSSLNCFNTAPLRNTTLLASRLICWAGSLLVVGSLLISSVKRLSSRFRVTLFFLRR